MNPVRANQLDGRNKQAISAIHNFLRVCILNGSLLSTFLEGTSPGREVEPNNDGILYAPILYIFM